eukprot:TRINITY_DN9541_c0_g2_i8.p1 TRINITY_DN9541_c0_g2~~TRINITY_DN9541_c0_g2_i8.p1  ORF type:complete len:182 (+),score=52.22 TRINITY_DN9541_c0_g2_i8:226-771(+)
MGDLDVETKIDLERMAMNKRIAEFKTQQQKELKAFVQAQTHTFEEFSEQVKADDYTVRPQPYQQTRADDAAQSMSLPRSGMFFFDDEGDSAELAGLGILEGEEEVQPSKVDLGPIEELEEFKLDPQEEEEHSADPDEDGEIGGLSQSLPMDIPMHMAPRRITPPTTFKMPLDILGDAPAEN